jgi:uncharacterized protein DUF1631
MSRMWVIQFCNPTAAHRRRNWTAAKVANQAIGRALDSVIDYDCVETDQLKLSATQIPLSLSLRELVLQKYADPHHSSQAGQLMDREELLGYLRTSDNPELAPLDGVLAQTEVIGDPAVPTEADSAGLKWIETAFDLWEKSFPLEPELAAQLKKLKPVAAVSAVLDADFYIPGAHPLHRILDTLHKAANGWQKTLGRASQPVLTLIEETVDEVLEMADERRDELAGLARSVVELSQRNQFRADRMATRAAETELGRLKAAQSKVIAADMINKVLRKYPVPVEIGRIMRGPWFESAQLVFLKFGEESEQWQKMSSTTSMLLESLQPPDEGNELRRQELFESVSGIPAEVKQWLLSMQQDTEAVEQILNEIEYAHLRIMRNQSTKLENIPEIEVENKNPINSGASTALKGVRKGQWFLIRTRKGDLLRVQATMMDHHYQQLLFCNLAGIKVQTLDFANFQKLLENGTAQHLDSDATFSRALIVAAGIESDEALQNLGGSSEPPPAPAATTPPAAEPATDPIHVAPDSPLKVAAVEPDEPQLPGTGLPDLPMGTWLGFHDVDPPLLAKLALHDKVRRLLIFVNRKGIEQRRLEEEEYLQLIKQGMVDIMEASNNFREQVERARQRMQNHQK